MIEAKKPRGRPRPLVTIDRDERIYALLTEHGPLSRNTIAAAVRLSSRLTYLALDRLRTAGRIRKCIGTGGGIVWAVIDGEPCA